MYKTEKGTVALPWIYGVLNKESFINKSILKFAFACNPWELYAPR